MASNTIEITAALSPEYQAAFASAIDLVKKAEGEMRASSKELANLEKLQTSYAKAQEAASSGTAAEAKRANDAHEKLAARLKMTGVSMDTVTSRMEALKTENAEANATIDAYGKKAKMAQVTKDLDKAQKVAAKFKDPAIQAAFAKQAAEAKKLGIEVKTSSGAMAKLQAAGKKAGPALAKGFGIAAKGAAVLAAGAGFAAKKLFDMTNGYIDASSNTMRASKQLEMSAESLQELRFAFGLSNVAADEFDQGLEELRTKQAEAMEGSKEAEKAFIRLGISMSELENLNVEELLMRTSQGLTELGANADTGKLEKVLFGGKGSAFGLVLRDFDGVLAGRDEAIARGIVQSTDQLKVAENAGTERFRIQQEMEAEIRKIMAELAPIMLDAMGKLNDFLKNNPDTFKSIAVNVGRLATKVVGTADFVSEGIKAVTGQETVADIARGKTDQLARSLADSAVAAEARRLEALDAGRAKLMSGKTLPADEIAQLQGLLRQSTRPDLSGQLVGTDTLSYLRTKEKERLSVRDQYASGSSLTRAQMAVMLDQQERTLATLERQGTQNQSVNIVNHIDARGASAGEASRIVQAIVPQFRQAVVEATAETKRLSYGQ